MRYYSLSSVIILDLMSDSIGEQAAVQIGSKRHNNDVTVPIE